MCPVAAESKNSKPSSKKKINKKINTNLETVVEENSQNLQTSSGLNESSIENNNEFNDSEEDRTLRKAEVKKIEKNCKMIDRKRFS